MPPEINLAWVQSPLVDHAVVTDEKVRWCTLTPGICVLNAIIFIRHSATLQLTYRLVVICNHDNYNVNIILIIITYQLNGVACVT